MRPDHSLGRPGEIVGDFLNPWRKRSRMNLSALVRGCDASSTEHGQHNTVVIAPKGWEYTGECMGIDPFGAVPAVVYVGLPMDGRGLLPRRCP